ncbi:MAG: hypothetical protein ABIV28_02525 [Longimicrobiales bacterium]
MKSPIRSAAIAATTAVVLTACSGKLPHLPDSRIPEPRPSELETVLFMMGDAGEAHRDTDPVMRVMQADVERWSDLMTRDSTIIVLFLGDNVYPAGLHDRTDPLFPEDSAKLQAQVDVVNGRRAREKGVRGIFIPGNHDWGQTRGLVGIDRLHNQDEMLKRRHAEGSPVRMMPSPGTPGPQTIDIGTRLRILLMDSAWWMLTGKDTSKQVVYREMKRAVDNAGTRDVVVAAHHPFRSASSHGGLMPFWSGVGLRYLLNRSGAVLQDLSSLPYRSLTQALLAAFAEHPPLVFAGGHDHNLQVIDGRGGAEPKYILVSGAGSKNDGVGYVKGMRFRHAAAGYMRLMFYRDGRVDLFVISAPGDQTPKCIDPDPAAREKCMVTTANLYSDVYSARLK